MKKRSVSILILCLVVSLMTSCVKVIKIGEENKYTGEVTFSASENVSSMWAEVVKDISDRAVDLEEFLKLSNGDFTSLAEKYGKYAMGNTGSLNFAVKGSANVVEVDTTKKTGFILLKLDTAQTNEIIKIQIGPVYKGSSTRDTLNIINFGDYTNQEEWGAVSKELHNLIDEKVIKASQPDQLKGKRISFVGSFTVKNNEEILITPVVLEVE